MMKRILSLLCVLVLLVSGMAFAEEDRLGGLTLPLVDADATVTLFYGSMYEHTDDTWLFQRIKERTGVQIHPLCFPKDIVSEKIATYIAGAERVFTVLDEADEDMSGEALLEEGDAVVSFRNVNFSYVPDHPVLRDFTLTIPAGKKVALVGATGSGKTTVVNLLLRFYDIDSGEIRINGQNIADVSRDTLRRSIAIVLQDTVLFSDTVVNNLKYANDSATQGALEQAVEASRCKDMIARLPEGLDTMLTASGANISQGQRQLLAIARAFVADPRILILDEATSNVDTRTERDIQSAGPDKHRDCPPSFDHTGRRPDRRHGQWADDRERHPRGAIGAKGKVL